MSRAMMLKLLNNLPSILYTPKKKKTNPTILHSCFSLLWNTIWTLKAIHKATFYPFKAPPERQRGEKKTGRKLPNVGTKEKWIYFKVHLDKIVTKPKYPSLLTRVQFTIPYKWHVKKLATLTTAQSKQFPRQNTKRLNEPAVKTCERCTPCAAPCYRESENVRAITRILMLTPHGHYLHNDTKNNTNKPCSCWG